MWLFTFHTGKELFHLVNSLRYLNNWDQSFLHSFILYTLYSIFYKYFVHEANKYTNKQPFAFSKISSKSSPYIVTEIF